jgi:hypothetical protein
MEKGIFVAMLVLLTGAIAAVDYLTGWEISFSIFYIYPIFVASWYIGRRTGIVLAVLSSILWLIADLASGHQFSHVLIPGWNMAVRLVFFLLIGVSVPYLRRELHASHNALQKLTSLLPLCAWCKNIRDSNGKWSRLEEYLQDEKGIEITHGICPDCIEKYYSRRANEERQATSAVA